jgi:hypothetical protein
MKKSVQVQEISVYVDCACEMKHIYAYQYVIYIWLKYTIYSIHTIIIRRRKRVLVPPMHQARVEE